jgi:hypothetical protein
MKALGIRVMAASILAACLVTAQTPDAQTVQALQHRLDAQKKLLKDWGGLIRYGSENSELQPPKPGEDRVVFLGDQVTEMWGQDGGQGGGQTGAKFFPGKPFLNRGIDGQTAAQMLVRFHQDVVSLKP